MRHKTRVGVLMGGISSERNISLLSGAEVITHLPTDRYEAYPIEITRDQKWIFNRTRVLSLFPRNDLKHYCDVVFVALHGAFGEDGTVQAILETLQIPYTGSDVRASALGMNKIRTSRFLAAHKIAIPRSILITNAMSTQECKSALAQIGFPCIIKPNASGSSVGISVVHAQKDIAPALRKAFREGGAVIAQAYIRGREFSCGVMGNTFSSLTALPPIEIITSRTFFDYHAKYHSRTTQEICPAPISLYLRNKIAEVSLRAHTLLGCSGLTRSDFMLTSDHLLYFLEINTILGITQSSLCPKAARAAGIPFPEFLHQQVQLALLKMNHLS
ncbi:MAG: D-alanine--D-alanine ligase [Patescibacteria group bacterium]|nr:D-alanine--D-alanine ligase [Patescibacteria group bacterium]MDE2437789.1 D-alanine--D-alanine ligase [Patescibacteria group bacterium]